MLHLQMAGSRGAEPSLSNCVAHHDLMHRFQQSRESQSLP
jgi:hypothetical protein